MTVETTDVIIVGAGPVGLYAVAQLGMQGRLHSHVIDSLDKPGGQPAELYPDKPIYDIPGIPIVTGQELTDNLLAQAEPFEPVYHMYEAVEGLEKTEDGQWLVSTDRGTQVKAPTILISSGRGLFDPRKPKVEDLEACEDKSVFYAVRHGVREKLKDKRVLIAGGGDSALDWVLALADEAAQVTLIHRRDSFRAAEDSVEKMKDLVSQGKINFLVAEAAQLNHTDGHLDSVRIKTSSGEQFDYATDYFLPFFGMVPKLGALAEWGLDLERNKIVIDQKYSATSIDGIFAIGDACTYDGKQELILTGFQESAHATAGIYKHIHGKELRVQFTTSSSHIQKALGAEKHVDNVGQLGFETPIAKLIEANMATRVSEPAA